MAHSYTCLLYHLVFSTKDREPWLHGEWRPRLWEYLSGAIRSEGGFCLLANGVADHIHLLARLRQDKAVSDVLRAIEANSSGWIHDAFPKLCSFHWQDGYGAFRVSKSQMETVRRYIARQEAHHRKLTFQEEFVALLGAGDRLRRAVHLEMNTAFLKRETVSVTPSGFWLERLTWAQASASAPPWATRPSPPVGG
jgi:putative transposase